MEENQDHKNRNVKIIIISIIYGLVLIFSLNYKPVDIQGSSYLPVFFPFSIIIYLIYIFDFIPLIIIYIISLKGELSDAHALIRLVSFVIPAIGFIKDKNGNEYEIVRIIRIILTIIFCIYFILIIFQNLKINKKNIIPLKIVSIISMILVIIFSSYYKDKYYYLSKYSDSEDYNHKIINLIMDDRSLIACSLIIQNQNRIVAKDISNWAISYERNNIIFVMKFLKILTGDDIVAVNEKIKRRDFGKKLKTSIEKGDLKNLKLLFKKGAKNTDVDRHKRTPFYSAIIYKQPEIVKYLIEKGENLNSFDENTEYKPLQIAAGQSSLDVVKVLVEAGCNINEPSVLEYPPLGMAVEAENIEICEYLIKKGADVNQKGNIDWSPLHIAAERGLIPIAELLLKNGAKIDARNSDGSTPLFISIDTSYEDLSRFLIDHGADINALCNDKETPFSNAVKREKMELVEYMNKHNKK